MNATINRKKERHLLEMLLPFLGVLAPYKISIIPVTAIVLLIIWLSKWKLSISSKVIPFFIFFSYMVFRDLLHLAFSEAGTVSSQINRMLEYSVLYLLVFFIADSFDEAKLYR